MAESSIAETAQRPVIAIVGGGIGGLYAAYLLGRRGFHVTLLEQDERLGGRIETVHMPPGNAFLAEFGPMRFEPDLQRLLDNLVRHLGLEFDRFAPTTAPRSPTDYEEEDVENFDNTADLLKWAVLKMFFDADYEREYEASASGPEQLVALQTILDRQLKGPDGYEDDQRFLDELRQNATLRGKPNAPKLRDLGLWNALAEFVSPGALTRIRDSGTFYHFLQHNPSAVEWGIFWLRQASKHGVELKTIKHGVSSLVEALVERIEQFPNVELVCGAKVVAIENGKRPVELELTVRTADGVSYEKRADHVILALPQASLSELASCLPPAVREDIDAVMPLPLLKAFLVTDKPWWKPHTPAQSHAWLAPTRELHYYTYPDHADCASVGGAGPCGCGTPELGMVMLYTDVPSIEFWRGFIPKGAQNKALVYTADEEEGGLLKRALVRHLLVEANPNVWAKIDRAPNHVRRVIKEECPELDAYIAGQTNARLSSILHDYAEGTERTDADKATLRALLGQCFRTDEDWLAALLETEAPLADEELVLTELPHVVSYGIRDWSRMPFGGAAHVWRAGADPVEISKELRAFALNGSSTKNVHICGEAYSDFQGFIEGALRSAWQVCDKLEPGLDWKLETP